ncbi:MAG: nuclear transport factor 2 family protein [Chloroflexi bacterium]|nr:nuclear transport factor 2 family protein [Chloroflexota bacterium]MDA1147069.1 nuclear transport factor 2 family protein [Chloroflexota bacterium]
MSNTDTIRAFLDAFNAKDIDRVMSFFSDDAIYHNIPTAPVHGAAAIRKSIEGYTTPASAIDWELVAVAETAGGTVLTERLDRFDFSGHKVELPVMGAFDFEDGKILAWRDYFDLAQFQKQMPGN